MEEEIYLKANVLYRLKETGDKVVPVDCLCVGRGSKMKTTI